MDVRISFDERVNHLSQLRRDDNGSLWADGIAPGASCWVDGMDGQVAALRFVCPCGCGSIGTLSVRPGGGGATWKWDGDRENPTTTPSIQKLSPCRWHGYLTKGEFKPC